MLLSLQDEGHIAAGCFSPDGNLAYLQYNGAVHEEVAHDLGLQPERDYNLVLVWDLQCDQIVDIALIGQMREGSGLLAIDSEGRTLLLRDYRSSLLLRADDLTLQRKLPGKEGPWSGGFAGTTHVWLDGSTLVVGDRGSVFEGTESVGMWAMTIDQRGGRIFVAGGEGPRGGLAIHTIATDEHQILRPKDVKLPTFGAIHYANNELILAGWDGCLWRWPLTDAAPHCLGRHGGQVSHLSCVVSDGHYAASLGGDGFISVWCLKSERRVQRVHAHGCAGEHCLFALHPQTGELLTGAADGTARLWPPLAELACFPEPDMLNGNPFARIGHCDETLVVFFAGTLAAFTLNGTPSVAPIGDINWMGCEEDFRKLVTTSYNLQIGIVFSNDKRIAATATNRRVEIHSKDSPILSLPLQYPAAAIGIVRNTLVVIDVFGQVNCWAISFPD